MRHTTPNRLPTYLSGDEPFEQSSSCVANHAWNQRVQGVTGLSRAATLVFRTSRNCDHVCARNSWLA